LDPHGFAPGGSGGINLASLTGSGPFYYASYTSAVSCLLKANRFYFKPIFPNIDTNPTTIHIDWGIFKANVKSGDWTVNVLDLISTAGSLGAIGCYGGWIPADVNRDNHVNVLDFIIIASNIGATW
jgi:hypothetical protein